ncbi:MAG: hypothetical protein H7841_00165 [Magnetospirillum sp. WYHS-4]
MVFPATLEGQAAAALAAVALIAPPLAYVAPLGLAPLAYGGAALALSIALTWRVRPFHLPPAVGLPLLLLGVWALASSLWAVDSAAAIQGALRFLAGSAAGALLFGLARRLDDAGRKTVRRAWMTGIAINAILLALEFLTGGEVSRLVLRNPEWERREIFWLNRDLAFLALLAWPMMLGVGRGPARLLGLAALPALAAVALAIHYNTGLLALGAGGAAAVAAWVLGRRAGDVLGGLAAAAILAAPLLTATLLAPDRLQEREIVLPNSAYHRAIIWNFAVDRIAERPWLGWGMAASPRIPGGNREIHMDVASTGARFDAQVMPLHPHNIPLQVWLELGAVGAFLLAALAFVILREALAWAPGRPAAAAIVGQYATALIFVAASFGAWQNWWHGALWIAVTLMAVAAHLAVPERT